MHTNCLSVFALLLIAAGGLSPAEPDTKLARYTFKELHMGTQFKIVLYAPDEVRAKGAAQVAFERIKRLDLIMSDYRPASELMQLCRQAGGEPVRVSNELFFVLSRAQEVAKKSDGAFDVTVGPIVRLWRRAGC